MIALDPLGAIAAATDHALIVVDSDDKVTFWNRGAERMFGASEATVLGKAWAELCPDGDELLATRPRDFDGWLTRADRTQIWASGSTVRLDNGSGLATILRDRTAQKVRETEAIARLADLERMNANCNAFLATLAHELRNQISPLLTGSHLLHLHAPGPEIRAMGDRLERHVRRLSRWIEDLMDMARVRQGKVRLKWQPVNLCDVVRQAVETLDAQLEAAGHELKIDLPESAAHTIGDLDRLVQVVVNLLSNAIKYTPSPGKIAMSLTVDGQFVDLRVVDTGIGLSADSLDTIFELFVQADANSPQAQNGMGVGLAIVKDLVQLHGGTITASSAGIGRGAEFIVRLPTA